jgi:hypothetical protein
VLREFNTIRCESVDVGCGHVAVMKTDIRPAKIIGKNEEDVWLGGFGFSGVQHGQCWHQQSDGDEEKLHGWMAFMFPAMTAGYFMEPR